MLCQRQQVEEKQQNQHRAGKKQPAKSKAVLEPHWSEEQVITEADLPAPGHLFLNPSMSQPPLRAPTPSLPLGDYSLQTRLIKFKLGGNRE